MRLLLKQGLAFFMLVFFFFAASSGFAQAKTIEVYLNGEKIAVPVAPMLENSRVLVPIRVISENIGAVVNYTAKDKKIEIINGALVINLQIGSQRATVSGKAETLDTMPKVINGTTLVPLRFVGESLGLEVNWNNTTKQVLLIKSLDFPQAPAPSLEMAALEERLLELINQGRNKMGLESLIGVEPLKQMARLHSQDMLKSGFFSHISPAKGGLEERGNNQGLSGVGENIAMGYPDADTVYNAWMTSATHRENILAPGAVFIGLGFAKGENTYNSGIYCTADFLWGEGFFYQNRGSKIQGGSFTVKGYAQKAAEIIVFRLDPADEGRYTARESVAVSPAADYTFSAKIELPEKGIYLLCLGNDQMRIDNR